MDQKKILTGALVGLTVIVPLTAIMYLGWQVLNAPFAPFDTFNWLSGVLPGAVITFGIDLMISTLRFLGLEVASAAKTSEQIMALGLFILWGSTGGVFYFYLAALPKLTNHSANWLLTAAIIGAPITIISLRIEDTSFPPVAHFLWLAIIFFTFGFGLNSIYKRLEVLTQNGIDSTTQPSNASVKKVSRRKFLIYLGGTTAAITVVGAGLGRLLGQEDRSNISGGNRGEDSGGERPVSFPNADASVKPVPGTRPEYTPLEDHYRVFIELEPTNIEEDSWQLPIRGLVNNPLNLTLDDIRNNYEVHHHFVTLRCISGKIGTSLIGTTLWSGASLKDVLADAGLQEEAKYLILSSGDGYYETIDIDMINNDPRIMLTYNWDGKPLPKDHGFPLRVWIPDVYGMKQPKWITSIEITDTYKEGYWVERGWDKVARINTSSVIDTVAVKSIITKENQQYVPIGGIAYSGARGISKVEVQVDGGEWIEAQIREPLSETTWVIWRYEWPYQKGNHEFSVRAYEADGTQQILEKSGPRPDGVTGIHSLKKKIL